MSSHDRPPIAPSAPTSKLTLLLGGSQAPKPGPNDPPYSEAEFLTGSRGTKRGEQTEKIWARLHHGYMAEIRRWMDSRLLSYPHKSDLVTHAVIRHLSWLEGVVGPLRGSVLHNLKQMDVIVADRAYQARFVEHIEAIAEMVGEHLKLPGGKAQVGIVLRELRRQIEQMEPGYYTSLYERMFSDRFGAYERAGMVLLEGGAGDGSESVGEHGGYE